MRTKKILQKSRNFNRDTIYYTKEGGCILASDASRIPQSELNKLMEFISVQFFIICAEWKKFFLADEICFFC